MWQRNKEFTRTCWITPFEDYYLKTIVESCSLIPVHGTPFCGMKSGIYSLFVFQKTLLSKSVARLAHNIFSVLLSWMNTKDNTPTSILRLHIFFSILLLLIPVLCIWFSPLAWLAGLSLTGLFWPRKHWHSDSASTSRHGHEFPISGPSTAS